MEIASHGGFCCGARHIYGFSTPFNQANADREWNRNFPNWSNFSCEAILTEAQLHSQRGQQWAQWLKEKGFKFVNRWRNSNSGNVCYRFVCTKTSPRSKHPPIMEIFNV